MDTKPTLKQLRMLVGNPSVYAVQLMDRYAPVREPLTDQVLQDHLDEKHTVGTYIGHKIPTGTVAKTLVFDFDEGEEGLAEVKAALSEAGLPEQCWGVEFSGKKGYHIWVVLEDYAPSWQLRRVGAYVCALSGWYGEVNPKQDEVTDLGNLVKLPGGVHVVSGRQNNFITDVPQPLDMETWAELVGQMPDTQRARSKNTGEVRFPCMQSLLTNGVEEGWRNNGLFHLAVMLRRSGLTPEWVERVVRSINDAGDPIDEWEVERLLSSSVNSGPLCSRLPQGVQCGDLCLLEKTKGLVLHPDAVRHAADGERVVVEVTKHEAGDGVHFKHPDLTIAQGKLRGR